jgi:hypothetical protein
VPYRSTTGSGSSATVVSSETTPATVTARDEAAADHPRPTGDEHVHR